MDIFVINVDRKIHILATLVEKIIAENPIAAIIQDPPCKVDDIIITLQLAGYTHIMKPTGLVDNPELRNNLILIRKDATTSEAASHLDNLFMAAEMQGPNGNKFLIVSAYIRPRTNQATLTRSLGNLQEHTKEFGQSKVIITGDFNATDADWAPASETSPELINTNNDRIQTGDGHYSQVKLARGRHISTMLRSMKLVCLNNPNDSTPTFTPKHLSHTNQGSHIDATYAGCKATRIWNKVELVDIGAQHKLSIIKARATRVNSMAKSGHTTLRKTYKYGELNAGHFLALSLEFTPLQANLSVLTGNKLADIAEKMTRLIIKHLLGAQESVTVARPKPVARHIEQRSSAYTRERLSKLTNRLKTIHKSVTAIKRRLSHGTPNNIGHDQRAELKRKLRNKGSRHSATKNSIVSLIQRELVSNKIREREDLWERVEIVKSLALNSGPANASTDKEEAEISLEALEGIADEKFGQHEPERDNAPDIRPSFEQERQLTVGLEEVSEALKMVRRKRFTGPEGLKYETLTRAAKFILPILHSWCATCLRAGYTPNDCKLTHGAIIPKKTPGKYRIVHIGSPLTSLLERVALSRLDYTLERLELLSNRQYGFCANISRHDLITRVLELAIKNRLREGDATQSRGREVQFKRFTTIVSLDIRGAFDNVNQDIIRSKLIQELSPDPIRVWLANFIINRRIILKHRGVRTKERRIRQGVPQGSIIGPVLWNFTINKIDAYISLPCGELELLAYADDLVMVYLGGDVSLLQSQMNALIRELTRLKLEVEPEKCSIMCARFDPSQRLNSNPNMDHVPTIYIYDKPITKTSNMSILGVPISHQLRLNLNTCEHKLSLQPSAQLLNSLHRLQVVRSADEWRILLTSYLTSILVDNNAPLLALDHKARDWCDKTTCRAIKKIFDWPSNVSNKVTRLLTGMHANARALTTKMLTIKAAKPNGLGHQFLLHTLQLNGNVHELKTAADAEQLDYESIANYLDYRIIWCPNLSAHVRRYHNPTANSLTRITEYSDREEMSAAIGPTWVAIEGGKFAIMAEIYHTQVLQVITGRHTECAIGYFNLMGIVMSAATDEHITNRNIAFLSANSLIQALSNMTNHDWRVISLRETLNRQGWTVCTLSRDAFNATLGIVFKANSQDLRVQAELSWLKWPSTEDYGTTNQAKHALNSSIKTLALDNRPRLVQLLSGNNTKVWAKLNPSWISGKTALMLSGMVTHAGKLLKGDLEAGVTPVGCTTAACARTTNHAPEPHTNQHATLHRAFHCPRFIEARREIRRVMNLALQEESVRAEVPEDRQLSLLAPWKHEGALASTIGNLRMAQSLLRLLTKVAMTD